MAQIDAGICTVLTTSRFIFIIQPQICCSVGHYTSSWVPLNR